MERRESIPRFFRKLAPARSDWCLISPGSFEEPCRMWSQNHLHEGSEGGAFIHWISSPIGQGGSTVSCNPCVSAELLLPAGQRGGEKYNHSALCLHLQGAGPSLQGTGFCFSAWSKRWGHRDSEIHERPPTHLVTIDCMSDLSLGEVRFYLIQSV